VGRDSERLRIASDCSGAILRRVFKNLPGIWWWHFTAYLSKGHEMRLENRANHKNEPIIIKVRLVLMVGRRDSEKRPAAGCLVRISDSKASSSTLLTGLQPHPIKRQQIRGGFNFGLTATKGLVFVLDGSFRGARCRIERVSRK